MEIAPLIFNVNNKDIWDVTIMCHQHKIHMNYHQLNQAINIHSLIQFDKKQKNRILNQ